MQLWHQWGHRGSDGHAQAGHLGASRSEGMVHSLCLSISMPLEVTEHGQGARVSAIAAGSINSYNHNSALMHSAWLPIPSARIGRAGH